MKPTWRQSKRPSASFFSLACLWLLVAGGSTAQTLPTARGVNFYSVQQEIRIGKEEAESFAKSVTILRDPQVAGYLEALGAQLAANAPSQDYPYSFAVFRGRESLPAMASPDGLDWPEPTEAIAIAGGPIFLPARLVAELSSEAELAAVLSHAIAHIALRHVTRRETRTQLLDVAATNMPPNLRMATTMPLGMLSFARRFEREADIWAIQILARSRYNPAGLVQYLENLPGSNPVAFSYYPSPRARIYAAKTAILLLPAANYKTDSPQFESWKRQVAQ